MVGYVMLLLYAILCVKSMGDTNGSCVIRELHHDRDAIDTFRERLPINIEWHGEGIPGRTQRVLLALLRENRHHPSSGTKAQTLADQSHACNMCGATFHGDLKRGHIAPLHSTCQGVEQIPRLFVQRVMLSGLPYKPNNSGPSNVGRVAGSGMITLLRTQRPPPPAWCPHAHKEGEK